MLLSNINCTPATKKREKEKKIKDEGRKEGRKGGREGEILLRLEVVGL